jgi:hypothetical protein
MFRSLCCALAIATVIGGCATEDVTSLTERSGRPGALAFEGSEWSEPVHLPAPISSTARDLGARLSADELTIYFGSDRDGGSGAFDIWVSRRGCRECEWKPARNLGTNINSLGGDGGPEVSVDGHWLFFSGSRTGSVNGSEDIWVSHRTDVHDDLGWGPAVNLGPFVNTGAHETGPAFIAMGGSGGTLYFSRDGDIYEVSLAHDGTPLAAATVVTELSDPTADAREPSVRGDGKEMVFWSTRDGGAGASDIWVSRRQNVNAPWSTPVSYGAPINTARGDLVPDLSRDGRTLIWSAAQTARPSLGFQDFWMSTRKPGGGAP